MASINLRLRLDKKSLHMLVNERSFRVLIVQLIVRKEAEWRLSKLSVNITASMILC